MKSGTSWRLCKNRTNCSPKLSARCARNVDARRVLTMPAFVSGWSFLARTLPLKCCATQLLPFVSRRLARTGTNALVNLELLRNALGTAAFRRRGRKTNGSQLGLLSSEPEENRRHFRQRELKDWKAFSSFGHPMKWLGMTCSRGSWHTNVLLATLMFLLHGQKIPNWEDGSQCNGGCATRDNYHL